ncbi:hypothetical protein RvY_01382 [Ramazzottius varieornatus]|uniref:Uncharacterized protein n=1 Tax=Ramazzottius varieornatus TaxID=947166 RepID=A0A1D1UG47_RAMVA|nr:hypothetical protein RvY_01382 [Ramazzottius varieornatus]
MHRQVALIPAETPLRYLACTTKDLPMTNPLAFATGRLPDEGLDSLLTEAFLQAKPQLMIPKKTARVIDGQTFDSETYEVHLM